MKLMTGRLLLPCLSGLLVLDSSLHPVLVSRLLRAVQGLRKQQLPLTQPQDTAR